jgi:hypothetical protein
MELGSVLDGIAAMRAAYTDLSVHNIDTLTHPELLQALGELEALTRQLPTISHRILGRLEREATPKELGAKSLKALLVERLRISGTEAKRRLDEAADLGPRAAMTGEPLAPVFPKTAAGQAAGRIGAEHVAVIREFFTKLPHWVDATTREVIDTQLARIAASTGPEELRATARELMAHLDQDGPVPDDAERARKRRVVLGPQGPDGMSTITGNVDPEFRATWEPLLAKFAAPGMCNPADEDPCTSGTPSQEQIDGDHRSYGQRVHDAFLVVGRMALCSGQLGQLNGLPVTVIVSTTLQDLESAAGVAVTGGGSKLPMRDLIRMSSHAHHYLAIYDKHTRDELYLGRAKRLASIGQRLMLAHRDRGCTRPGCPAPAYASQVHHVNGWAKDHGLTNINTQTLACGGDNRLAEEGWTVQIRHGIVEWIPPPRLDVGQPRINYLHHPERLLQEPDDEDDEDDGSPRGSPPAAA